MKKSVVLSCTWLFAFLCLASVVQAQWLRTSADLFPTASSTPITRFVGQNDHGPMPIDTQITNAVATKGSLNALGGRLVYNPLNGALGLDTIQFQISIAGSPAVTQRSTAIIGNYNFLVCQNDIANVKQNDTVLINVHANDFSKVGVNTFITTSPVNGISNVINNQVQYIPNVNFIGLDSFEYFTIQTAAPFDSAWAWVKISVCPSANPIITSSIPQFGGMQLNIVNSSAFKLPLYYGIINDTNNKSYGYSAIHPVNSYAQSMFWNTPQVNGTHIGCVYVSDSRGCSARTCLTSYITNCNPPPSANFVSNYDSINNQLFIAAATQNNATIHSWELKYQSPYINNPIYSGTMAVDSIKNILLPGNYVLTHISADISMQCADTLSSSFQVRLPEADTFSGYAFTDLNVDGLLQNSEPAAPAGTIVWVANAKQPLFYLNPDAAGHFSIIIKPDSLIWGITPTNLTTIQTAPVRPLIYHTPKGSGHWNISGLLFGLHPAAYHVHGRLYIDMNSNNSIDPGEPILRNHSVSIKNKILVADSAGIYHYFTSSTNALSIVPTAISGYNASVQQIQPFAGISDYPVDISFIPQNFAFVNGELLLTSDEDTTYNSTNTFIHIYNSGTQALNGSLVLNYPDSIRVVYANDSGKIDSLQRTITWQLKNPILCAQEKIVYACWKCYSPNALLKFDAKLLVDTTLTDIDTLNNQDTLELLYSVHTPNFKWASPLGKGISHAIIPSQVIRYGISARNPLLQPVINITILDTLDKDLSYKTWKFLTSNFPPSSVSFENGVATITFNDCFQMPGSRGNIEAFFKVSPWPGLPLHKQIRNNATIYWDDQQHTHTNTVYHTIEYFLAIENLEKEYTIRLYPNPASTQTSIQVEGMLDITNVIIYSTSGLYLGTARVENGRFNLSKSMLKPGSYMLSFLNGKKMIGSKMIILE